MKIAQAVRILHANCDAVYQRLAADVEARLKPRAEQKQWFFLGRVKQLESFALKLETGRFAKPSRLEDFYACTIVVRTLGEIEDAERLVTSLYHLNERRPTDSARTQKSASNFIFDDLRLYVEQLESISGRDVDLNGLPFEVQIKTILQHAWGVATHDLIYKSDSASWARERIAFQVKAMLEHAEIAIAEANRLANAPAVAKTDRATADTSLLLHEISQIWSADQLPTDRKRLAETIMAALRMCDLKAQDFTNIIEIERKRIGLLPANLSPYSFTIQSLANSRDVQLEKKLSYRHNRTHVFIHDGMDLPEWMRLPNDRIVKL